MTTYQNALDYAKDQMQRGLMTADEANVAIIRMIGIRVVEGKMPIQVRRALLAAVKNGGLGRIKSGHLRPEIFFHPNSKANAISEQNRIFNESTEAIKKCF